MKRTHLLIALILLGFSTFALNPSREYATTPADYGMSYEEIAIKTSDSLTLKGWLYKATEATSNKIIILSDDGDGNMADLIEQASNFISLGYNVISYDYRGYGKSADFTINKNFFIYAQFQKDLEATLNYVKKYHAKIKTIHLYGVGIGAGLSLGIGANRTEVSKIIADSPYSSFEDVKNAIKEANGTELSFPLGFNKTFLEPMYALEAKGGTLSGILIITGENEKIYSPKMAKKISNIRSSISSVFTVKGATAANTFSTNKTKYFEEIQRFLK